MWLCPECKLEFPHRGSGTCPCGDSKNITVYLVEKEELEMSQKIKYEGSLARFAGQKTGKLLSVEPIVAKTMSVEVRKHVGLPINEASVRQYLLCQYVGEKGVPFADLIGYGGSRLLKLQKEIGTWFDIDCPIIDAIQEPLNFDGQVKGDEPQSTGF